jgi:hypothetical protein
LTSIDDKPLSGLRKIFYDLLRSDDRESADVSENCISVLVIGKAKTGTTVLAKTIQNSLNDCSLTMEPKDSEFVFKMYGKSLERNHVAKLIFEHWTNKSNSLSALLADELPVRFDKKIIIVRDPRDEIVSRLLYFVKPLKDQGRLTEESLSKWISALQHLESGSESMSFIELIKTADTIFETDFLASFFRYLGEFSAYYSSKPNSVFAIRYEDLVDRKVKHLETYLGFELNFDLIEDELIRRTKRSSSYGSWKAFFKDEDVEYFRPLLSGFMEEIGYTDWALDPNLTPSKAVTSEYVKRLAFD